MSVPLDKVVDDKIQLAILPDVAVILVQVILPVIFAPVAVNTPPVVNSVFVPLNATFVPSNLKY